MRAFDKIDMIVTDTYNPKASIANNKTVKSPTASDICGSSSGFRTNVRSVPSTTPTIDSPSLLTQSARTDFLPTNLFRLNEGIMVFISFSDVTFILFYYRGEAQ